MKGHFFFLICLGYVWFVTPIKAQTLPHGGITGHVIDNRNQAFEGAIISLYKASDSSLVKSTATDKAGTFILQEVTSGTFYITVAFVGFKKNIVTGIQVASAAVDLGNIPLRQRETGLKEVVVVSKKPFIERLADKTVLNVASDILSSGSNALEILKKAPGVTIDKDDNIILKGKPGVTVMLDGKLTYLSGAQITTLLKNMPASAIEQIEVITQPSAKYDAAGTSGIINIRTKKLKKLGLNGVLTTGFGYGKYGKYSTGLDLNYNRGKFNFFGNYNFSYDHSYNTLLLRRIIPPAGNSAPSTFNQGNVFTTYYYNHDFKSGVDIDISKKQSVTLVVSGYSNNGKTNADDTIRIQGSNGHADSLLKANSHVLATYRSLSYNLSYKNQLDTNGSELGAEVNFSQFYNVSHTTITSQFYPRLNAPPLSHDTTLRNDQPSKITVKTGKADYTRPFSKTAKLDVGMKISRVITDNNAAYDTLSTSGYLPAFNGKSYFVYKENVNAGYVSFNNAFKKFTLQLGLRVEQTLSDGHSITVRGIDSLVKDTKRRYIDLFPNLVFSKKISENHALSVSYTRRIDRPSYDDLNPFVFLIDKYTLGKGSPNLRPQYTHSFEIAHTFKQNTITTFNFSWTRDVISQLLVQNDTTKVTYQTRTNLNNLYAFNLSSSIPIAVAKWWNLTNNLNLSYNKYSDHGASTAASYHSGKISGNVNITSVFNLPKDINMELNGFFNSPFIYGEIEGQSMYAVGIGIQKSFLSKKANFKLNVNDIFNTNKFVGHEVFNGIDINVTNRFESRRMNLTFTYRFGSKPESVKNHDNASGDEQSRVKKGH